jgi:hypothetical protein
LPSFANAMRQIVRGSKLDRTEQDDFLRSLATIPVTIKAVAPNQGRNGDSPPLGKIKKKKAASRVKA